jgi:hypothetical protein
VDHAKPVPLTATNARTTQLAPLAQLDHSSAITFVLLPAPTVPTPTAESAHLATLHVPHVSMELLLLAQHAQATT